MISAWIGSLILAAVVVFYVLLALGAPLGEYAMGGRQRVLTGRLRIAAAVSAGILVFMILVLLQLGGICSIGLPQGVAKVLGYIFGGYLVLNTLMNAVSKSKKERYLMTPLAAVAAACYLYTTIVG